jgi:hypothetical protein
MFNPQLQPNPYNTSPASGLPGDGTSMPVELFLSGRNLLDMDVFSKSDPYIKVYFRPAPNQQDHLLGRT